MNQVVLIGRLTKDPELKFTSANQTAVVNFTLAVDRPFSKEKEADFIRIIAFGKSAENCGNYLAKGSMVGIQGRIQTGSYETKDGDKRFTTDVVADRVEFLSKAATTKKDAGSEDPVPDGFHAYDEDDEDVPF